MIDKLKTAFKWIATHLSLIIEVIFRLHVRVGRKQAPHHDNKEVHNHDQN